MPVLTATNARGESNSFWVFLYIYRKLDKMVLRAYKMIYVILSSNLETIMAQYRDVRVGKRAIHRELWLGKNLLYNYLRYQTFILIREYGFSYRQISKQSERVNSSKP